jgi:hypothetical protein
MSNLSSGNTLRVRAKSRAASGKVGYISADERLTYNSNGAAGVTSWLFVAPAKCRVVSVRELHSTPGAGASKVFIRKHKAAQTAAPTAAVSGTNIVDLVTGGVAADSASNVSQISTVVTTTGDTPAVAYAQMNAGDKLAVVCPGAWIGVVDVYVIWTA